MCYSTRGRQRAQAASEFGSDRMGKRGAELRKWELGDSSVAMVASPSLQSLDLLVLGQIIRSRRDSATASFEVSTDELNKSRDSGGGRMDWE